jgi:cell wall assembly regulator SMI1
MPQVVTKPITNLLAELESLMRTKAPQVFEQLQPGLSADEIATLERHTGIELSDEVRTLYRWHNGGATPDPLLCGPIPGHRFVPLAEALGESAALSNQVSQATTVSGRRSEFLPDIGNRG